jgi:hypothetical protein
VLLGRRLAVRDRARFAHVDRVDVERARVVVVPVLTPGVVGVTLGRWILLRRGHGTDEALIAHELVHVEQWRRLGPVRFLRAYLGDYVRARREGLGHDESYRAIRFEVEARIRSHH